MKGDILVHGIVLGSMPIGEYDRRITILTAEKGRISAFVKGARRPLSAFSACTQTFTYAEFTLYAGKDSYNLKSFDRANYFEGLSGDITATYMGIYFCELAGALTREDNDESDQFKLLYVTLLALSKHQIPVRLIKCVFEIKAIAAYGEAPVADGVYYSRRANGLSDTAVADSRKVGETVLYTVRYILSAPPSKLYSFTLSEEVLEELVWVTEDYMSAHIDKELKSLEILKTIIS